MSIEIRAEGVDVAEIMRSIREAIEEKRQGLYSDAEIREIAERRLDPVLDSHELKSDLVNEFLARPERWNFAFDPETLFRSSRGVVGRMLERVRRYLRPVQKLFWNPNPMISALSRQADLNRHFVHLLHNLVLELTKMNLELQELRARSLQLQGRLDALARREKTLEDMVVYREDALVDAERTTDRPASDGKKGGGAA